MPLASAHVEYVMLPGSARDGRVFEWIPEVAARYQGIRNSHHLLEIWKFSRQIPTMKQGYTLPIQASVSFRLNWSKDDWQMVNDTDSTATALGIEFVDIPIDSPQTSSIHFTLFWTDFQNWENSNYQVAVT